MIIIRQAIITVSSVQRDDNETYNTEIITKGTFEKINSGYLIQYDETDETGYEGAHTSIRILNGNKIEMIRTGSVNSELIIEENIRNVCLYGTPYGEINLGVLAKSVKSHLTDIGGSVSATYVMDMNMSSVGHYELSISVK